MTSVLHEKAAAEAAESPLLSPAAARRDFEALVTRLAEKLVLVAAAAPEGVLLGRTGTLVDKLDADPSDTVDLARWQDALSEAVLELLSRNRLALTVDQRLVPVDTSSGQ